MSPQSRSNGDFCGLIAPYQPSLGWANPQNWLQSTIIARETVWMGSEALLTFQYFLNFNTEGWAAFLSISWSADFLPRADYRVYCSPGRSFHCRVTCLHEDSSMVQALIRMSFMAGLCFVLSRLSFVLRQSMAWMSRRHVLFEYFPYLESYFTRRSLPSTEQYSYWVSFLRASPTQVIAEVYLEALVGSDGQMAGMHELVDFQSLSKAANSRRVVKRAIR